MQELGEIKRHLNCQVLKTEINIRISIRRTNLDDEADHRPN